MSVPSPIVIPNSPFETLGLVTGGITGTAPAIFTGSTTLDLGALTATGLLNGFGDRVKQNDIWYINYSDTSVQPVGGGNANMAATLGQFYVSVSGSNVSLVQGTPPIVGLQFARVSLTTAQIKGMYATPVLVLAAQGANDLIVVQSAYFLMTYATTQYTTGGATGLQYDSTANLGGSLASSTIAGADINGATASSSWLMAPALDDVLFSASVNKGIYISNDTAAFAVGDSTAFVDLYYQVLRTV